MHALKVLEFDSIRERLRQHCETGLAEAAADRLAPSFHEDEVWSLLAATREAHELLAKESPPSLGGARDLRAAFDRAAKGGTLGGVELYQAAECLQSMRAMRVFLKGMKDRFPRLSGLVEPIPEAPRLEQTLFESIDPGGDVKDAASPALARLRQKKFATQSRIVERIQSYVSGKARDLLSDPIYTVRDGRYVIPLKAENRGKIKGVVHDTSGSGQTVYLEPDDVLQLGNALREAEAAERDEVERVLAELSAKLAGVAAAAIVGIEGTAEVDLLLAKGRLSFAWSGAPPERRSGHGVSLVDARHPLLDPETAVPLTIDVGFDLSGLLITGPNTGGKTVAIKTVGLCALIAQAGLFPPARASRLGTFTQVWADIGDEQSIAQSLSTFSGHIKNIAEALSGLGRGALVLLDEIGAGTDPAEGAALAKAVLLELQRRGASTLASTHYGELKAFAYNAEGFANAAMEFDSKTLRPTYRLLMGAPGASHALRIAERYGIPSSVIESARANLGSDHQDVAAMLEKLELAQRQARLAQSEADRRAAELRKAQAEAERKLEEAKEARRTANEKGRAEIEAELREIRLEAERLFDAMKRADVDQPAIERLRSELKTLQSAGVDLSEKYAAETPDASESSGRSLERGAAVRVKGYAQSGTLLDLPGEGQAKVQMGALKLTVPLEALSVAPTSPATLRPKARHNLGLQKAMSAQTEIHLRAMRAEDALADLERFLDDSLLAGIDQVRIVHGKGEGILRKLTRDYLRKHPHVASFREGEPAEGGQGVTVAVLK